MFLLNNSHLTFHFETNLALPLSSLLLRPIRHNYSIINVWPDPFLHHGAVNTPADSSTSNFFTNKASSLPFCHLSTNTTSFVYLHRLPEFINHVLYEQEVPPIIRNGAFFITCNGSAGGESLLFNFPSFVPSLVVFLNRTILFCFCL